MAENGLDFGVLGPLQITVDGGAVLLGTPKQRAVLARGCPGSRRS
jgi:DNA-binding SARP family transcriptional activator